MLKFSSAGRKEGIGEGDRKQRQGVGVRRRERARADFNCLKIEIFNFILLHKTSKMNQPEGDSEKKKLSSRLDSNPRPSEFVLIVVSAVHKNSPGNYQKTFYFDKSLKVMEFRA